MPFNGRFVWLNPLSHLIEIVRYPLLDSRPPGFVVLTTLLMAVIGWAVTLWLFNAKRNRIAYWL